MVTPTGGQTGRPRKPSQLKVLHGDFKEHPNRQNKKEPKFRGEVIAPETLSPQAREVWDSLANLLVGSGVLTPADTLIFAEFCESTIVVRLARIQVMQMMSGKLDLKPGSASPFNSYARAINVLVNLGGRFGLTPSDRSRLIVGEGGHAKDDLISSG